MRFFFILVGLICLLCDMSCSSHSDGFKRSSDPISSNMFQLPVTNIDSQTHMLLGIWTADFDIQSLNTSVRSVRELNRHYNVTSVIPPPTIVLNSYDPITYMLDIDVTLRNPYPVSVYDIRLIIFTDAFGHMLMNADDWTNLYDIPEGLPINPFKAYAKNQPNRIFSAASQLTENLHIYLGQGSFNVMFAVDASFPFNCNEPYAIDDFHQEPLYDQQGEQASIDVHISDWQDDVNVSYLYCPEVTGQSLVSLSRISGHTWGTQIENATGAQVGEYSGVIIAGSLNSGTLYIYDFVSIVISHEPIPSNPQIVNWLTAIFNGCEEIAIYGEYAYIGEGNIRTKIVNIHDPFNPVVVSELDFQAFDIDFQGDYAYACVSTTGNERLSVVDVSDPTNPVEVGSYEYDEPKRIEVKGDYAYIHFGYFDERIFDISDPTNPTYVRAITSSEKGDLAIRDNYLFIGSLSILDLQSDPSNPTEIGHIVVGRSDRIAVDGNYAYVLSNIYNTYIKIIDISDPTNPVLVGEDDGYYEQGRGFAVSNGYLYSPKGYYTSIMDVRDPANPNEIAIIYNVSGYEVVLYEHYLLLAGCSGGLGVVDVTDPHNPIVGEIFGSFLPIDVKIHDNYIFASESYRGFTIVDINDRENPIIIASGNAPQVNDFVIQDCYAFAGTGSGVTVLDISDITSPMTVKSLSLGNSVYGIDIKDNYLYTATGYGGLNIISIIDPINPYVVGSIGTENASDIKIQNDYAFIADDVGGFKVIDISNPANPIITGSVPTSRAYGLDVNGNYAYIADGDSGLKIIDITDPYSPVQIGEGDFYGSAMNVDIVDDYAYIAASQSGLVIVDVHDPTLPFVLSSADTPGSVQGIEVIGYYAYLADSNAGMAVVKLW